MGTEAFEKPGIKVTIPDIAGDMTANQYRVVAADGTLAATQGTGGLGILQNKPDVGQNAEVMVTGISKAKVDEAITVGQKVTNAVTNGMVEPALTGDYVVGIALTAGDTQGDIIAVLLSPGSAGQLN